MTRIGGAALLALVVGCTNTGGPTPTTSAIQSSAAAPMPVPDAQTACRQHEVVDRLEPSRARGRPSGLVAFTDPPRADGHSRELHLYDAARDSVRRLVSPGPRLESEPRWRDQLSVSFVADRRLRVLDRSTREARTILRFPRRADRLYDHDWSPSGRHLAYLAAGHGMDVVLLDVVSGRQRCLRQFDEPNFRGAGKSYEVAIRWSPDGHSLSVVNAFGPDPAIHVLDRRGRDRMEPTDGTLARWAHDSTSLFVREVEGARRWRRLAIADASVAALSATSGTVHVAISPSGRYLAATRDGPRPRLFVLDLTTKVERSYGTGLIAPLWLDDENLAATTVKPCRGSCGPFDWFAEASVAISVLDGSARPIALPYTYADSWANPRLTSHR